MYCTRAKPSPGFVLFEVLGDYSVCAAGLIKLSAQRERKAKSRIWDRVHQTWRISLGGSSQAKVCQAFGTSPTRLKREAKGGQSGDCIKKVSATTGYQCTLYMYMYIVPCLLLTVANMKMLIIYERSCYQQQAWLTDMLYILLRLELSARYGLVYIHTYPYFMKWAVTMHTWLPRYIT